MMNQGTMAIPGKEKQGLNEKMEDENRWEGKIYDHGGEDEEEQTRGKAQDLEDTQTEAKSWEGGPPASSSITVHKNIEDIQSIPNFVQEHSATLSFPEKLMLMLTHVERECAKAGTDVEEACVGWILEGRAFAIRNKQELVDSVLPVVFRKAKFPSFTRKLYRWGFRQVSISADRIGQRQELIFGHENFQRNNKQLLAKMRSVTAAGTRRAIAALAMKQQSAANRLSAMTNSPSSTSEMQLPQLSVDTSMKNLSDLTGGTFQQQQPSLTLISQQAVNRLGPLGNPMIQNAMAAAIVAAQQQQQQQQQNQQQQQQQQPLGSAFFNSSLGLSGQNQHILSQQYLANLSALAIRTLQAEAAAATESNASASETGAAAAAAATTASTSPATDRLHAAVDLLLRFASP